MERGAHPRARHPVSRRRMHLSPCAQPDSQRSTSGTPRRHVQSRRGYQQACPLLCTNDTVVIPQVTGLRVHPVYPEPVDAAARLSTTGAATRRHDLGRRASLQVRGLAGTIDDTAHTTPATRLRHPEVHPPDASQRGTDRPASRRRAALHSPSPPHRPLTYPQGSAVVPRLPGVIPNDLHSWG